MKLYRLDRMINDTNCFPHNVVLKMNTEVEWKILKSAILKASVPNDMKVRKLQQIRKLEDEYKGELILISFPYLDEVIRGNISPDIKIITIEDLCLIDEIKDDYEVGDIVAVKNNATSQKILSISDNRYITETHDCGINTWHNTELYGTLKPITEIVEITKDELLKQEKYRVIKKTKDIQESIRMYEENIKTYECSIRTTKGEIEKQEKKLNNLKETIDENKYNSIFKEIEKIKSHKLCEDVNVSQNGIEIITKHLYITEPYTNRRYSLGRMLFTISPDKSKDITMYNLTETRNAYENEMQHPHIFRDGIACTGTATNQIAYFRDNNEYMALYLTLLNFCQTVDIDDSAGWKVSEWDEVNDNNEIINRGHYPEKDEYDGNGYGSHVNERQCAICGEYEDEDDMWYCDECDEYVCDKCWNNEKNMCVSCAENYYICKSCGNVVYCDDAIETECDGYVCNYCYDDYYAKCAKCGAIYSKDDMIYDEETEKYYCIDCDEEREE